MPRGKFLVWMVMFTAVSTAGDSLAKRGSRNEAAMSPRDGLHCWLDPRALRESVWAKPILEARVREASRGGIGPRLWEQLKTLLSRADSIFLAATLVPIDGLDALVLDVATVGPGPSIFEALFAHDEVSSARVRRLAFDFGPAYGGSEGGRIVVGSSLHRVRETLAGEGPARLPQALLELNRTLRPRGTVHCVFRIPKQGFLQSLPVLGQGLHMVGAMAFTLSEDIAVHVTLKSGLPAEEAARVMRTSLQTWAKSSWFYLTGTQFLFENLRVHAHGGMLHMEGRWMGRDAERLQLVLAALLRLQFPRRAVTISNRREPRSVRSNATGVPKPKRQEKVGPPAPPGQRIRTE